MKSIKDIIAPRTSFTKQWNSPEWTQRAQEFRRKHGSWCRLCRRSDVATQVHHINYLPDVDLADHPDEELALMCVNCHKEWTKLMRAYRKLFSSWDVPTLTFLFGVLKVAKEKYGTTYAGSKLMQALEKSNFI